LQLSERNRLTLKFGSVRFPQLLDWQATGRC